MIPHSQPWITKEDRVAVDKVLSSGMITGGGKVQEFEQALTEYIGSTDTVVCGSGTAALVLALLSLNIGKGDEVILPTYVCGSVADSVRMVGATPVLCDIGEFWNVTPETVALKISSCTKAIIVVHIFGITADITAFLDFGLPVIEDCCQAFGGKHNEKTLGTFGTLGIYSFHATKCLTTGEGGAVTSNNHALMKRIRSIRDTKFVHSSMTDLQAVLGLSQLSRYSKFLDIRSQTANYYLKQLPCPLTAAIKSVQNNSIFFRFPLRVQTGLNFDEIQGHFAKQGIAVRRGVDELLHRRLGLSDKEFSNAVEIYNKTLSLPIYPSLTKKQLKWIAEQIRAFFIKEGYLNAHCFS